MAGAKTPMMQQYEKLKEANADYLLFYRMGDFYELFNDDAITAANILDITLTRRRTNKEGDEGYPMCGVPFHASESYIAKLIENGYKVALCEQTETPAEAKKARGNGALVNREVVRLYTGGTLTEDSMLKAGENNYLLSLFESAGELALAWADLSTGDFFSQTTSENNLHTDLARIAAGEILLNESLYNKYSHILKTYQSKLSMTKTLSSDEARGKLEKLFEKEDLANLKERPLIGACGTLLHYVAETGAGKWPTFKAPTLLPENAYMQIDETSRTGLELTATLRGAKKGSLIHAIDRTTTPAASRLLSRWITAPLQNVSDINQRQSSIHVLKNDLSLRSHIRDILKETTDISRALSRITLERGSPRDLGAIRQTLTLLPELCKIISRSNVEKEETLLPLLYKKMTGFDTLRDLLKRALKSEQLPMLARDGNFIESGFCEKFDGYKKMATGGMETIRTLEAEEGRKTNITNLRIKYNKVWGYFFEVTKSQTDKIPEHWVHRQTTTNAQRYSSPELMELERAYSSSEANMLTRELELFDILKQQVQKEARALLGLADALAELDVLAAAAELAEEKNYVRPTLDYSNAFQIEAGRHCVVENTVETYISNNCDLSNHHLWLITGPNMAGKSTFLRQNALIAIMAHAGLFVPASKAHIGVVDKIFTRIGAGDDLAKGQSTFMMEMVETANILKNATDKSLVVLDEIGRGTATYDGLSIAWACVEHLLTSNKCRGLFATHYHEMTELENTYQTLKNYHVAVKEWQGDIIFLHKVQKGCAPSSYGVHVGKLAGLPASVTNRASQILQTLEKGSHKASASQQVELPLFSTTPQTVEVSKPSEVDTKLLTANLDDLTPREAQNLLYELKSIARG